MRVLLCCAAIVVAIAIAGCGSDSGSSSTSSSNGSTTSSARPTQTILHYVNREARPPNPGPHPTARVDHLIIKDVRKGQGRAIGAGDFGTFDFIATNWITGRPLEASWKRRRPFETQIEHNVVIDGWWQGIPGMRTGGRRQIIIPPSLGFTTNPLLQEATTFFDVTLVQIRPQTPAGLQPPGEGNAQPQISAGQ